MHGSLSPRRPSTYIEREHQKDIAEYSRHIERREIKAAAVARVTQRAILEATTINLVVNHAQTIDPAGSDSYTFLAAIGVGKLAQVIQEL